MKYSCHCKNQVENGFFIPARFWYYLKKSKMSIPAIQAFNEIIYCLKNAGENLEDIESYMSDIVNDFVAEYKPYVTEWSSNYHKVTSGETTSADTLFFGERRIVIAYQYLHDDAKYIHIIIALMKDLPKPNLSVRKAIFLYDAELQNIMQVQDELPEL